MQIKELEQIILAEIEKVVSKVPENKTENLIQFLIDNRKSLADFI